MRKAQTTKKVQKQSPEQVQRFVSASAEVVEKAARIVVQRNKQALLVLRDR